MAPGRERMSAFLKIDRCGSCHRETPWEQVAPVHIGGKLLAGTGVWRSTLVDGLCAGCTEAMERQRERLCRAQVLREQFIRLVGGVKPYREFTFDKFQVASGNRIAFQHAQQFDPSKDNLCLSGPCRAGKTHLAVAILRQGFARGASIARVTPSRLIRKLRMKTPEEEQNAIDGFIRVNVLLLDGLGAGHDTAYGRQILEEILDGRDYKERGGLVVTSRYSLSHLAYKMGDDAVVSRLTEMCAVLAIKGADHRRPL